MKQSAVLPIVDMTADEIAKELKSMMATVNLLASQAHALGLEVSFQTVQAGQTPKRPPQISVSIKREL